MWQKTQHTPTAYTRNTHTQHVLTSCTHAHHARGIQTPYMLISHIHTPHTSTSHLFPMGCTYPHTICIPHTYPMPKLLSHVCLCDPMDCSQPGSSVHEILQASMLEWVAIPFSRVSSQLRDQTQISYITGGFFTIWTTREAPKYWSG